MSKKQKSKSLNWEDFQALGSPENAPRFEDHEETPKLAKRFGTFVVRIHLEKKKRGGKTASIIRGLKLSSEELKDLSKDLKKVCGVGGACKNGEIIIQGNNREKIMQHLQKLGVKDVKMAGG